MQPLEGLIDELKAEGVFDLQGRFTVRSDGALERLRQSRLGDPDVYAVALFRAIVTSGARRVSVDWDLDDLRLDFDGPGLPPLDQLALAAGPDRATRYLQVGLLGAMSMNPQLIRYRGPEGGWNLVSPELPIEPDPCHRGPLQLQIRRRLGKTLLWTLARRVVKEMREVESLRQHCASTEVQLEIKGKPAERLSGANRRWEVSSDGALRLRLRTQLPPLEMPKTPRAPMPLHAVFWAREFPGPGSLWVTLAGATLPPIPLPWDDCEVAVSLLALDLDLSQEKLVDNQAYRDLLEWLGKCWFEILRSVAEKPQWQWMVTREILRPHSPLRDELSHLPLFGGRSLDTLCRSVIPVGGFPKEIEQALVRSGARLRNDQLGKWLVDRPDLRAEVLVTLAPRHGLRWALADFVPDDLLTLGQGTRLAAAVPEVLEQFRTTEPMPEPSHQILAYLEAGLLHPEPVRALAEPHPLGAVAPTGETSINVLFQHFLEYGELTLTETSTRSLRGGEGFHVSREVALRIFLGLYGESITWNNRYTQNALAADRFVLYPLVRELIPRTLARFSAIQKEGDRVRIPLADGQIDIDLKNKSLHISAGFLPLTIPGRRLKELARFERGQGDPATNLYETICFTDGLHNFVYCDGDTDDTVQDGARTVMELLGQIASP